MPPFTLYYTPYSIACQEAFCFLNKNCAVKNKTKKTAAKAGKRIKMKYGRSRKNSASTVFFVIDYSVSFFSICRASAPTGFCFSVGFVWICRAARALREAPLRIWSVRILRANTVCLYRGCAFFRRPTRIGIRERQRKMRGVRAMEKLCASDHFAVFFLFFADKFFHGFDGGHIL